MSVYLLTGGSGVVGSALVPALLAETQAEILLLLRPGPDGLAARRDALLAFWARHYPLGDTAAVAARVRVCAGDITAPGLGLAEDVQQELRTRCTHIIHCAAQVRMNLALEQARRSAVDPVAAVLALARECHLLQKIEFVSTVGVGAAHQSVARDLPRRTTRCLPQHLRSRKIRGGRIGACSDITRLACHCPPAKHGDW